MKIIDFFFAYCALSAGVTRFLPLITRESFTGLDFVLLFFLFVRSTSEAGPARLAQHWRNLIKFASLSPERCINNYRIWAEQMVVMHFIKFVEVRIFRADRLFLWNFKVVVHLFWNWNDLLNLTESFENIL